ncbi:MAG: FG-GAP-like repeat-containing protein [Ignavibacteriota bacterium]
MAKPDVVAVDYIDYPNPGRLPIVTFADNSATQVGSSADIPSDSADGMSYVSMAAADIDGDGRPDLLLTDPRGGLLVITGGGDGTFHAPAGYPVASPSPNIYTGATTVGKYDDYWGSITTADFRNSASRIS